MSQNYQTVGVRISKEKKKKWEEHVEESHQPSLSQLVRVATERQIARGNPLEQPEQAGSTSQEPAPEVMHKLEEISNKLQSMDRRLSAIESDRYGDEDLSKLATEIYKILPSSVTEIQRAVAHKEGAFSVETEGSDVEFMLEAMADDEVESTLSSTDTGQNSCRSCTGSIDDIADRLDADEEAVQLAINRLQNDTHAVDETESGTGTIHYYKLD